MKILLANPQSSQVQAGVYKGITHTQKRTKQGLGLNSHLALNGHQAL